MTPTENELVMDALGIAAGRIEGKTRSMAPGAGVHHAQTAESMRALAAKLHNGQCELADPNMLLLDVAGLSEKERDDLRAHVRGGQPGPDYDAPAHGWTCFHCGETFHTPWGARTHFGTPATVRPLCVEDPSAAAIARRRAP